MLVNVNVVVYNSGLMCRILWLENLMISQALCRGYPTEFASYFHYCRSLRFDDKPDYVYLKKIFRDVFIREGLNSIVITMSIVRGFLHYSERFIYTDCIHWVLHQASRLIMCLTGQFWSISNHSWLFLQTVPFPVLEQVLECPMPLLMRTDWQVRCLALL